MYQPEDPLSCQSSLVKASKDACKLDTQAAPLANLRGLTALKQLESLELQTFKAYPSLEPIYGLDLLKELHIEGDNNIPVTAGLSRLSNLTNLQITGGISRPLIKLDVPWHNMHALQVVHVVNVYFTSCDMVALIALKDLRTVDFVDNLQDLHHCGIMLK